MYTDERNAQILISLLKAHGIRKIVASPGTTNACLVASLQNDPFFEMYSAPEERSGGYIACGMAAECGEPVVLSCTGATASRNYMPALTEAYYRKLPILAVTSSRRNAYIGHNLDQVTDRTKIPKDIAKISVQMPVVLDDVGEWQSVIAANKAILELKHHGGGPVHINLETTYSQNTVSEMEPVRSIFRFTNRDILPELKVEKVAIVVGAHIKWNDSLIKAVDLFCHAYNGIVVCDHTSNYKGKYRVFANILTCQQYWKSTIKSAELVIHIGDILSSEYGIESNEVWRVNPDGELRDTYRKLKYVFEFQEEEFFTVYAKARKELLGDSFLDQCLEEEKSIYKKLPDLPLSSAWAASVTNIKLPNNAVLHLGIRNSLRTWNYFDTGESVLGYSNTGGFGIDGSISSVIGAALANPSNIFYCVLGDLAFFYDMNALGNRHLPSNIRILLINNGIGYEMKCSASWGNQIAKAMLVESADYIAASGHYARKSTTLVKHYAEDLGFDYICAHNKKEYLDQLGFFLSIIDDKPVIFELFINPQDEEDAGKRITTIMQDQTHAAKNAIKGAIGEKHIETIKSTLKKMGIKR